MPGLAPTRRLARLPPIRAVATRGGRLTYIRSGQGQPTLLLFNGAGMTLQGWEPLYPAIERLGTVLAWNRFGVQGSDAPRERQTGHAVLAALRELLAQAGVQPPYVLVAHSLGALHAQLFARLHPQEVAGVAFIEGNHPDDEAVLKKHEPQLVRALGKVLALPQALFRRNVHSELACVEETVREIAAAGPFPPVPLRVITGGVTPQSWRMSPGAIGAKRAQQQELARLSPRGVQVIAQESGHFPQLTQPALVMEVLRELAGEVR